MIASDDSVEAEKRRTCNKSISVHRAFVYSACAPGFGETYAGSRIRGFLTAASFLFFFSWFTWTSIDILANILDLFLATLEGTKTSALPDLPVHHLIIALLGSYTIWLWAILSSVDLAMKQRRKSNDPPQASVPWGVALSWFCPGSGQLYTDSRRLGYIVFCGYLAGILLTVPPYMNVFQTISSLAKKGHLSANNPYEIVDLINEHLMKVNYSFGSLFQMIFKYFAIASTVEALKHRYLDAGAKWMKSSVIYGAVLLGTGWLCPGSGQLLQGRNNAGWVFFVAYLSSVLFIGLTLGADFMTIGRAETLSWISTLVQWAAMIEAALWMIKHEK